MGLAEHNCLNMENKKLIRFAQSFLVLPLVSMTLPLSGVVKNEINIGPQVVLLKKINTEASSLLAFNQTDNQELNTKIRQIRARAIDDYFRSRELPLVGYGDRFVQVAEINNLDWRLLPAIAMIETTGGKNLCKSLPADKKWNPFGWGSCKIGFESFDTAIDVVARNLGGNNPNTARYYKGKTNREILDAYNPPSVVPDYSKKVMKVMEVIGPVELGEGEGV